MFVRRSRFMRRIPSGFVPGELGVMLGASRRSGDSYRGDLRHLFGAGSVALPGGRILSDALWDLCAAALLHFPAGGSHRDLSWAARCLFGGCGLWGRILSGVHDSLASFDQFDHRSGESHRVISGMFAGSDLFQFLAGGSYRVNLGALLASDRSNLPAGGFCWIDLSM